MAKVSIIIPAHNPGTYLREALQSVHGQTYADWEVVVVDDNSSEELSWVSREFPRARLIRQAHGGASVARNNGILNSAGEYISFMDQDDVWRPAKLARQVVAMDGDSAIGVCYCDLELIDAEGKAIGDAAAVTDDKGSAAPPLIELDSSTAPVAGAKESNLYRSVQHFSRKFVVPSTVMVRRSCLATSGLLDPFIPFSGDYDLLIKLGGRYKVARVPTADVLYRKHENNFSDRYEVRRKEVEALVTRYVAYAESRGDTLLARDVAKFFRRPGRMYSAQAFDCARRSLKKKDYGSVARHLSKAFWFSPTFMLGSVASWLAGRFRFKAATTK